MRNEVFVFKGYMGFPVSDWEAYSDSIFRIEVNNIVKNLDLYHECMRELYGKNIGISSSQLCNMICEDLSGRVIQLFRSQSLFGQDILDIELVRIKTLTTLLRQHLVDQFLNDQVRSS